MKSLPRHAVRNGRSGAKCWCRQRRGSSIRRDRRGWCRPRPRSAGSGRGSTRGAGGARRRVGNPGRRAEGALVRCHVVGGGSGVVEPPSASTCTVSPVRSGASLGPLTWGWIQTGRRSLPRPLELRPRRALHPRGQFVWTKTADDTLAAYCGRINDSQHWFCARSSPKLTSTSTGSFPSSASCASIWSARRSPPTRWCGAGTAYTRRARPVTSSS